MLHHVSVGVRDVERAATFYDAVLAALGYKRVMEFLPYAVAYGDKQPSFWVQLPHNQQRGERRQRRPYRLHRPQQGRGASLPRRGAGQWRQRTTANPVRARITARTIMAPSSIDFDGNKLEATLTAMPKPAPKPKTAKAKAAKKPAKKAAKKAAPKKKKAKRKAKRR